MENNEYTFEVGVVAHIAQLVQLAMLTGTDIAEQLLLMRVVPSDTNPNKLTVSPSYQEEANKHIDDLVTRAEELMKEQGNIK